MNSLSRARSEEEPALAAQHSTYQKNEKVVTQKRKREREREIKSERKAMIAIGDRTGRRKGKSL